jgi:uncharacterized protein (DUF2225 family)
MRNPSIVIGMILSVIFFFAGIFSYEFFFERTLPIIGNVKYLDNSMTGQFKKLLAYSLTLGLIPLSTVLIWKFAPVYLIKRKILTVIIISSCIFLAGLFRYEKIKSRAKEMDELQRGINARPENKIEFHIPIDEVNIESYMFSGLLLGSLISYFSLKQKKNNLNSLSF